MTPKTLFNIILKIIGIFFIKEIVFTISQLIIMIFYITKTDKFGEEIWGLVIGIFSLFVYGLASYFFIFKSSLIINKLKLDKDFDEATIPLKIHHSTILSISIIVIGGLIIAEEIPDFCRQLFAYFFLKKSSNGYDDRTISYSILAAAKIIIGYLLIVKQQQIVNFIEYRRKR